MKHLGHLSKQFRLDVYKNGAVAIRKRGESLEGALPVYSVDTYEQAEKLQVRHCRLARDNSGIYILNDPPVDVDDLNRITELFRVSHTTPPRRKT